MDCLPVWLYRYRLNRLIQVLETNWRTTNSQRSPVVFLRSHIEVNPKIADWISVMVRLNFEYYPVFCCRTIPSEVSVFTHYLCTNFTHFCGRLLMNGKNKKNRYKWGWLIRIPRTYTHWTKLSPWYSFFYYTTFHLSFSIVLFDGFRYTFPFLVCLSVYTSYWTIGSDSLWPDTLSTIF